MRVFYRAINKEYENMDDNDTRSAQFLSRN